MLSSILQFFNSSTLQLFNSSTLITPFISFAIIIRNSKFVIQNYYPFTFLLPGSKSSVTQMFAPITEPSPMVILPRMVAFE